MSQSTNARPCNCDQAIALKARITDMADLFDGADDAFGGGQDHETIAAMLRDLANGVAIESIAEALGLYGAPDGVEA